MEKTAACIIDVLDKIKWNSHLNAILKIKHFKTTCMFIGAENIHHKERKGVNIYMYLYITNGNNLYIINYSLPYNCICGAQTWSYSYRCPFHYNSTLQIGMKEFWILVFNATFSNISAILYKSAYKA